LSAGRARRSAGTANTFCSSTMSRHSRLWGRRCWSVAAIVSPRAPAHSKRWPHFGRNPTA
jgi:hypothetical protein